MIIFDKIKRSLPLIITIILIVVAYFSGFTSYLTLENFEHIHHAAMDFVEKHPYSSPVMFMGIYIIYVSLALPGIILLTILGGFIFPQPLSTLYVIFPATFGGSILFFSTSSAAENFLRKKEGYFLSKMKRGFQQYGAIYLLLLRLVPLFPCWFVTVASALLGVRFTTFIWTTSIGITPCVFLLTQMGASIMIMLETEGPWTLRSFWIALNHL